MRAETHYATDMSDEQWAILEPLLPEQKWRPGGPGRPPCDAGVLNRTAEGSIEFPFQVVKVEFVLQAA